mmetsp:Transcript_192/g.495  ORF Transcript_192/g.495 Transcript_192/m.495 type:complete len:162 (-) Transcript_192:33-518(-)
MATGSRNESNPTDGQDMRDLAAFGESSIVDSHLKNDLVDARPAERLAEKRQREEEKDEFRSAMSDALTSSVRPRPALSRTLSNRSGPAIGPPAGKKMPTFVKVKSKSDVVEATEAAAKRPRVESAEAKADTLADVPESPAPMASPLGESLCGYSSSEEEDE